MTGQFSNALAAFVCTAETGSFAAAGKVLGISAPAVGQSVKRLEDAYGVVLIRRTTRKMNLTPDGVMLYERARGPLRALEELDTIFSETKCSMTGPLRITAPRGLAGRFLLPRIAAFKERHPGVYFECDFTYATRDFIDDGVDVAFRFNIPEDSPFIARQLTSNQFWTLASPDYLARHGEPQHPRELVNYSTLACQKDFTAPPITWHFVIDGAPCSIAPDPIMAISDPDVLLDAAALGLGITQMRDDYAGEMVEEGRLRRILTGFASPAMHGTYLCYPSRENLPRRVRSFIDFMVESMKDGGSEDAIARAAAASPTEGHELQQAS